MGPGAPPIVGRFEPGVLTPDPRLKEVSYPKLGSIRKREWLKSMGPCDLLQADPQGVRERKET